MMQLAIRLTPNGVYIGMHSRMILLNVRFSYLFINTCTKQTLIVQWASVVLLRIQINKRTCEMFSSGISFDSDCTLHRLLKQYLNDTACAKIDT